MHIIPRKGVKQNFKKEKKKDWKDWKQVLKKEKNERPSKSPTTKILSDFEELEW